MDKRYYEGIPARAFLIRNELEVIKVVAGDSGYWPVERCNTPEKARVLADKLNGDPLDPAVAEACLTGSMFGWLVPGADPKNYEVVKGYVQPIHKP